MTHYEIEAKFPLAACLLTMWEYSSKRSANFLRYMEMVRTAHRIPSCLD